MSAVVCRIVLHVSQPQRISIAVDGSVFHKYIGYKEEIVRALQRCLSSLQGKSFASYASAEAQSFPSVFPQVAIDGTVDGSGLGAAIIVAANAEQE